MTTVLALLITLLWDASSGKAWINPREAVSDPESIRVQQGRKELTQDEKNEVQRYGVTGLELMSYVKLGQVPGDDFDAFYIETSLDTTGEIGRAHV